MVLDGKSSHEYPVKAGVLQGSLLGPTLFLLYINDLPDDVIFNIAIYADDTTLYFKCDQASDLWQQPELTSEFESDLRDTVNWGQKWLVDLNAGKSQLVLFDGSKNTAAIDVKMDGSVLEEKSSFKILVLTFFSKLDWGSYIISIARSNHRSCSIKKDVLKNFSKFTGKHLCQSLFFNKVAGLRPAILLKRDSGTGVFL